MTQHELDVICRNGEGQEVEFKRNINSDLSKELVAFANAEGGRVIIGIDDGGKAVGIQIDNELKSRVEMMARDCDPAVVVKLEVLGNILIVNVPEGKDKPYRCTNGFYVRNGASSVKLSTDEIREFFIDEGKIRFEESFIRSLNYLTDIDSKALNRFVRLSGITKTRSRKELLINLGVLRIVKDSLLLNNAGALFFAKNPTRPNLHFAISCVLFKGVTKVHIIDRKMLEFDALTNIDQAVIFLERNLKLAYEIKEIRRKEILEIPQHVLREAIINAVAHRNYFEMGAHVVVEIFDDRVDISNIGGLPKGLKPEDFGKYSVPRNPLIATLLNRCNYIEKAGTGIRRMRQGMKEAGLPEPSFYFSGFFTATFYRTAPPVSWAGELNVLPAKLERIESILKTLYLGEKLDIENIALNYKVSARNIRKDLELLLQKGWVIGVGNTKSKSYQLTELGREKASKTYRYFQ